MEWLVRWGVLGLLLACSTLARANATFQRGPCPFEGADGIAGLECGVLIVPERRGAGSAARGERTLRLAVAVLRATGPDPAPDPIVFLGGGPGAGTVAGVPGRVRSPFWSPLREKRDLVFFDQRGTGLSDAQFCPEMDREFNDVPYRGLTPDEADEVRVQATIACARRLRAEGVDVGAYNSAASARDLADLRRALGYDQWNLFAISYGTRLALSALRDVPEGIRSVILDSSVPPDVPQLTDAGERFTRVLRLAFAQCAGAPACRAAFPTLEDDTYAVIQSLEADPVVLDMPDTTRFRDGRLVLDGSLWAQGIFQGFYDQDFLPLFPLAVQQSRLRNEAVLRALANGIAWQADTFRWGMNYAVNCYEVAPINPREGMLATRQRHPELAPWFDATLGPNLHAVCDAWHADRGGEREFLPVESDVPALILAGEFDPITPPSYGRHLARTLSNATFVEVPAMGHGPTPHTDCTRALLHAFLAAPGEGLDMSCADALPPAAFLTDVHLEPGVYGFATALQRGPGSLAPLAVAVAILLSAVLGWPLAALAKRVRGTRAAAAVRSARAATWLAFAMGVVALVFLAALALAVQGTASRNFYILAFGLQQGDAWILALPGVLALLAFGTVVAAGIAWRRGWWTRRRRLHYSAVAAAGVGIVALAYAWGFLR